MLKISELAIESETTAFQEGAEAGFWRGFAEGANANRRYIMGETTVNPFDAVPAEYKPLGSGYYKRNFAREIEHQK